MAGSMQRLELRQGQQLVMTPQLQQSLKLLQYSNQELLEFIDAELQKNPLLEKDNGSSADEASEEAHEKAVEKTNVESPSQASGDELDVGYEGSWDSNGDKSDERLLKSPAEEAQGLHINTSASDSYRYGGDSSDFLEQAFSEEPSLRDHLEDQVVMDFNSTADKIIASYMIDSLDSTGYFTQDLNDIAEVLQCKVADIERVLKLLQKCDPVGIFARNVQECLSLQLKEKDRFDPAMQKMVQNIELLAKGELKKLQKLCKVDVEDMEDMLAEIRQLNPRPAAEFNTEVVQTAQIDIYLRKNPDGVWALELNNEVLPRVLVNNKYYAEVKKITKDAEEKEFVAEQYNAANWLVKTLNQRAETILKVATELVAQQNDFFEKGIYHLKPMVLADIAKKIEMHESTVGRVTTNKYIATPRGVFELKYFFSSSLASSAGGDDMSSKAVKQMIKKFIDGETDFKSVLSDERLSELLKENGVDCARRTVAKYRESMQIPTSSLRKRQIKMHAGLI